MKQCTCAKFASLPCISFAFKLAMATAVTAGNALNNECNTSIGGHQHSANYYQTAKGILNLDISENRCASAAVLSLSVLCGFAGALPLTT